MLLFLFITFENRNDNQEFHFILSNLYSLDCYDDIHQSFDLDNYKLTLNKLTELLMDSKSKNKKRGVTNYVIGCTTAAGGTFPMFVNAKSKKGRSYIPRPYWSCLPDSLVSILLNSDMFSKFLKGISNLTIKLLIKQLKNYQSKVTDKNKHYIQLLKLQLDTIFFIKKHVPASLLVGESFFTQMAMVGDTVLTKHNGMNPHVDDKDLLSVVVTLGNVTSGGCTIYYNGTSENNKGKAIAVIPFQHGRIQIGNFSEIVHSVSGWEGNRITLNFNIKSHIVNHFREHSDFFYSQFVQSNFQKLNFLAK